MARLQILELPEGSGDDRPPFILVIDQVDETTRASIASTESSLHDGLAARIGARAILVFEDTIDIPANDTSAYLRGGEASWTEADEVQARATEALRLAHERTDIARDMDRLAKWKNELADALGMDPVS